MKTKVTNVERRKYEENIKYFVSVENECITTKEKETQKMFQIRSEKQVVDIINALEDKKLKLGLNMTLKGIPESVCGEAVSALLTDADIDIIQTIVQGKTQTFVATEITSLTPTKEGIELCLLGLSFILTDEAINKLRKLL